MWRPGAEFKSIVFAGGGNRCFWQVGFWETVAPALGLRPAVIAGVSAGACMAALLLAGQKDRATAYFLKATAANAKNFYPGLLLKGQRPLPHPAIFEATMRAGLDRAGLERLRSGPELRVLLARPPRWAGPATAAMLGILAYSLEKALKAPLHPQWPTRLGFTPEVALAGQCHDVEDLINLMTATCCTPPLLPPMYRGQRPVLDGGLIDNVPLAALGPDDGPALILLTRRYDPRLLRGHQSRVYIQPSRPIPVNKWDYASPDLSLATLELGRQDGMAFIEGGPEALQN